MIKLVLLKTFGENNSGMSSYHSDTSNTEGKKLTIFLDSGRHLKDLL